jgi:nitrous oxidase accessory protein NosD
LSSSNAVASAGDWGGIYLEQNANLTLTYAHLSYTGYGINSLNYNDRVEITHSRLERRGGGIYLKRPNNQTSTRVITDNVINVGPSDHALTLWLRYNAADPIPNISRNTITNPQGNGIYVRNAYQGLTIDANTIAVKDTGIQVSDAGGVVAITNNILDNTSTSNWERGSGVTVSSLQANGGADNAITSVTLQNNTIKKFGGNGGLYFDGDNQSITSSITGNTITDSDRQGVSIYNLQGTSITGNPVTGSTYAGVYLQNAVPSAFKDNVITGNGTTSNQPGL